MFSEFRIKHICCNDISNRLSTKSRPDNGVETSESVEGDQEMSGRLHRTLLLQKTGAHNTCIHLSDLVFHKSLLWHC